MHKLEWSTELSIKNDEIDNQHKKLILIYNSLLYAMAEKPQKQIIEKFLEELVDYCDYHFTQEERFMQEIKYSAFHSHKLEHDTFFINIYSMRNKFQHGEKNTLAELVHFLHDWILNHLMVTDRKIKEFIIKSEAEMSLSAQ